MVAMTSIMKYAGSWFSLKLLDIGNTKNFIIYNGVVLCMRVGTVCMYVSLCMYVLVHVLVLPRCSECYKVSICT